MSAARNLLDVARQIRGPTIIEPLGRPVALADTRAMIARLRELIAGRPFALAVQTAHHPDVDPFAGIAVKVDGFVVAFLGDRWNGEGEIRAALRTLEAAL
ncbi:hypothetical protein [Phenylobacterium sp.]|uniref:hypothetical protein n=1 Tax=Phenylobacterium sp. TaxID=1871053 RepID=UPI00394283DA